MPKPKAKVRRNLSARQIKYFGTPRQNAALRAKRSSAARPKAKAAARPKHKHSPRQGNPAEVVSLLLGNSATKRKNMATAKHKKKAVARPSHKAGKSKRPNRAGKKTAVVRKHKHRNNPAGLGTPMEWLEGAGTALGGGVGTHLIPQLILGANNVGLTGYIAMFLTSLGLGFGVHMLLPKSKIAPMTTVIGGIMALAIRVANDNTSYGSYLALSGMGDYLAESYTTPQRLADGLHSAELTNGYTPPYNPPPVQTVVASSGAGALNATPGGMGAYGNLW